MQRRINEAVVHLDQHGSGFPVIDLHGAGVDHREIEVALEAIVPSAGYRRIYPDLPGMGHSTADGLNCNDDVVMLLATTARYYGLDKRLQITSGRSRPC